MTPIYVTPAYSQVPPSRTGGCTTGTPTRAVWTQLSYITCPRSHCRLHNAPVLTCNVCHLVDDPGPFFSFYLVIFQLFTTLGWAGLPASKPMRCVYFSWEWQTNNWKKLKCREIHTTAFHQTYKHKKDLVAVDDASFLCGSGTMEWIFIASHD